MCLWKQSPRNQAGLRCLEVVLDSGENRIKLVAYRSEVNGRAKLFQHNEAGQGIQGKVIGVLHLATSIASSCDARLTFVCANIRTRAQQLSRFWKNNDSLIEIKRRFPRSDRR